LRAVPAWFPTPMTHYTRYLSILIGLVANLIPLFGVLLWNWDTFQLLMLYWMETVIVAFWALMRLARLPEDQQPPIVDREGNRSGEFSLVGFFALHSGVFITVHLVFLWALFSQAWLKKVHGVASFFSELFIVNGIWFVLLLFFAANWISYLVDGRTALGRHFDNTVTKIVERRRNVRELTPSAPVLAIVGSLYARIVILQIAIIAGAWFAQSYGSVAPLLLVIGLKILIDLGLGSHAPSGKNVTFSISR
jgi:Family of unknown function (DUF6498)